MKNNEEIKVGFNTHRLNAEDECCLPEIIMMDEYEKWAGREGIYAHLIQTINPPNKKLSAREVKIALSAIQWFATNCGRGFFDKADKRIAREMKELYHRKKVIAIEKMCDTSLRAINEEFNLNPNKTQKDYLEFAQKIKASLDCKEKTIANIPSIE